MDGAQPGMRAKNKNEDVLWSHWLTSSKCSEFALLSPPTHSLERPSEWMGHSLGRGRKIKTRMSCGVIGLRPQTAVNSHCSLRPPIRSKERANGWGSPGRGRKIKTRMSCGVIGLRPQNAVNSHCSLRPPIRSKRPSEWMGHSPGRGRKIKTRMSFGVIGLRPQNAVNSHCSLRPPIRSKDRANGWGTAWLVPGNKKPGGGEFLGRALLFLTVSSLAGPDFKTAYLVNFLFA
jgi:hypothetical protein